MYLVLADKVVVGSYMGILRIFSPHSSTTGAGAQSQADQQLLEVQLRVALAEPRREAEPPHAVHLHEAQVELGGDQ